MKKIHYILIALSALIILLSIKGKPGNPLHYQHDNDKELAGPFELSNSTARFALTETIAKNHSFFLPHDLAKFASPDIAQHNGKFISIFTPGVSFLALPFYIFGNFFGIPQLTSYLSTIIMALLNIYLVYRLARKLDISEIPALIGAFIFVFSTNALGYALGLTQHHFSTAFILLIFLASLKRPGWKNNILLGALIGAATLIDLPNLILLLPVGIYFLKNIKKQHTNKKTYLGFVIGVIPFIILFFVYNQITTGSFKTFAQNIGRSHAFAESGLGRNAVDSIDDQLQNEHVSQDSNNFSSPFDPRRLKNGLYILMLSNERSWLFYSPVLLLGFLGIFYGLKGKHKTMYTIVAVTIFVNIILYASFDDPWGGWSFGSRYLIPSAAFASLGVANLLEINKNKFLYAVYVTLLIYSIFISSIGALSTNAIPPKREALYLSDSMLYTYKYSLEYLKQGNTSSLIYNSFFVNKISTYSYFLIFSAIIICLFLILNINYLRNFKSKSNV